MPTGLAISRFQRFAISDTRPPRALPWAFAFRAFGAEDPAFSHTLYRERFQHFSLSSDRLFW